MKNRGMLLAGLVSLASIQTNATTNEEAFTALKQVLPLGDYLGHNSYGEKCRISFSQYQRTDAYSFYISSTDVRGASHQVFVGQTDEIDSYTVHPDSGTFDSVLAATRGQGSEDGPHKDIVGSFSVKGGKTVAIQNEYGINNCTAEMPTTISPDDELKLGECLENTSSGVKTGSFLAVSAEHPVTDLEFVTDLSGNLPKAIFDKLPNSVFVPAPFNRVDRSLQLPSGSRLECDQYNSGDKFTSCDIYLIHGNGGIAAADKMKFQFELSADDAKQLSHYFPQGIDGTVNRKMPYSNIFHLHCADGRCAISVETRGCSMNDTKSSL